MSPTPARVLMAFVRGYRLVLSPWLGNSCRFEPTCSSYSLAALERHGAIAGVALTVSRIGRCHPWCEGGFDPVPAQLPRFFTPLLARPKRRAFTSSSDASEPSSS
jgi:putative membrane protein insertion efficiency factor